MSGRNSIFCALVFTLVAIATTAALSLSQPSLSKRDTLSADSGIEAEPLTCEQNLTEVQTVLAKCQKGLKGISNCMFLTMLNDPEYAEMKNLSMIAPKDVQAEPVTQCEKDLAQASVDFIACFTVSVLCGVQSGLNQALTNTFNSLERR